LLDDRSEGRVQQRRAGRIQYGADVAVGGDPGYLEQALAVRSSMPFLELTLMREKGRALHEEDRERRHADVGHRIDGVLPPARVREALEASAKTAKKVTQDVHPDGESYRTGDSEAPIASGPRNCSSCDVSDSPRAGLAPPMACRVEPNQLLQSRFVRIENCWTAAAKIAPRQPWNPRSRNPGVIAALMRPAPS
jgi:hypothetical protein